MASLNEFSKSNLFKTKKKKNGIKGQKIRGNNHKTQNTNNSFKELSCPNSEGIGPSNKFSEKSLYGIEECEGSNLLFVFKQKEKKNIHSRQICTLSQGGR